MRPGDQISYWWIDSIGEVVTETASVVEVCFIKKRRPVSTTLNLFLVMESPHGAWNALVFKDGMPREVPLSMIALNK